MDSAPAAREKVYTLNLMRSSENAVGNSMHRFFVAPELVQQPGAIITLPKELAHQFRDVLHLQAGEQVMLLDNSGDEIAASIASVNKSAVAVQLLDRKS